MFNVGNHITEHGVYKLIDGIKLNTSKSSGPDGIPGKLLQSLANELAPVLRFIFEQSLLTGDLDGRKVGHFLITIQKSFKLIIN